VRQHGGEERKVSLLLTEKMVGFDEWVTAVLARQRLKFAETSALTYTLGQVLAALGANHHCFLGSPFSFVA
jgi:predicted thioesterase